MEVQGPGGVSGPNRIEPQRIAPGRAEKTDVGGMVGDRAEISEEAQLLARLAEVPDVRMEKVEELRELITTGRYESREKIEKAVDRLLEELS